MLSNVGELNNFLDTCRMGTQLRGCKALSVCTNVLGLRPMGWSVRCSIQRSIITFTETQLIHTRATAEPLCVSTRMEA
jgi:hypothetical protein